MRSAFALSVAAMASFGAAQEQYTIDPNTVDQSTRGEQHHFLVVESHLTIK
jgi:hypothetical protein